MAYKLLLMMEGNIKNPSMWKDIKEQIIHILICRWIVIFNLYFVHLVVCFFTMFCCFISMHCGLLAGEFSEFSMFKPKMKFLILWFAFATLCYLHSCTVDYKRVSSINFCIPSQTFISCWFCGLSLLCFVAYFNIPWITSGWVQWILIH